MVNKAHKENSSAGTDCAECTANNTGANNNRGVSGGTRLPCSIIAVHNKEGFYSRVLAGSSAADSRCAVKRRSACRKGARCNRAGSVGSIGSSSSLVGNRQTWCGETDRMSAAGRVRSTHIKPGVHTRDSTVTS